MQRLKSYIIGLTIFLIPLFFLPITHEFYNINKFMLISVSSIVLLLISSYQFYKTKEIRWSKNSLHLLLPMSAFLVAVALSTIITSINKSQAVLSFTYGPLMLAVLMVFYWFISAEEDDAIFGLMLRFSGFCVALITIILLFHPFDAVALPRTFQFLKNHSFSPIGTRTDLMLFLGFVSLYQLQHFIKIRKQTRRIDWFTVVGVALSTFALTASFLSSLPKSATNTVQNAAPLNLSVKTAVLTLSTPVGFVFGSGINNFSTVFTQVKDAAYNSSPNWSVDSYDNAFSAILQIVVESGALAALTLTWVFMSALSLATKKTSRALLGYLAILFVLAPASLMLFLLFFSGLGIITSGATNARKKTFRIAENKPLFLIGFINTSTLITLIVLFSFTLVPTYRAEVAMRNSVDAVANNNLEDLYTNQYNAVVLNPYIERYRLNFSQTNLLLAKHVATLAKPNQTIITSSIQQSINQAQAAIALNSKKASNWENLGVIYKNVLGVNGAEQWAIAAFQRAILLDPQNVPYRLELGGVFYTLKQYENAVKTFQEATLLKPDLPNSHYNLAHAHYQNQNSKEAVRVMDALLILLKKQSSPNYEKVLKERNDFASGTPLNQAPTVIQ